MNRGHVALLVLVLMAAACTPTPAQRAEPVFGVPPAIEDGWPTSSLEAERLSAPAMAEVTAFIRQDARNDFRSLLIARNGRLVFEGYFNGHDRDALHDIRSATKSITSTLVGIAIGQGLIPGVHAKVVPFFPAYLPLAHDGQWKRSMTLEHLLTMASGFDADEDDPATPGYEDRLSESADWVRFALDLPVVREPGRTWAYASVNAFLLGAVVEEASGRPLAQFGRERLFGPLGIAEFRWQSTPLGRTVGQGNLSMRARDMAKVGQLSLDRGRWAGMQVVPEAWVDASVVPRYPVPWDGYDGDGYGWYLHGLTVAGRERRYFFASGNGGNKIYVLPDEQMVVVVQSAAYNTSYGQRRSLEVLTRVLKALAP